jgi:hypothetical protein
MVIVMKFLVWSLLAGGLGSAAQLKEVKSVYFYPMPAGFEQHLANRIADGHVFQVVSDPKLADAVFTDQLSDAFLYKLDHIQTPPPPENKGASTSTMTSNDSAPHASSFTRGKGTLFLVDAKSKAVLWSTYQKPKNTTPAELEKTAKKVVAHLDESINGKPASHQ